YADVSARFKEIINELELDLALYAEIEKSIKTVLTEDLPDGMKLDRIKALGEDNSAKIVSSYLCKIGLNARYINPKEAGIIVSDDPGNAQILPESRSEEHTSELQSRENLVCRLLLEKKKERNLAILTPTWTDKS